MSILRRTPRVLVLAAVLAAAVPAVASATTRYVALNGFKTGSCSAAAPCDYSYVFQGAGSQVGDTVYVEPGIYDVGGGVTINRRLAVMADPNEPIRPVFKGAADQGNVVTVSVLGWGTSLKGIDIDATSYKNAVALEADGSVTASDVTLDCHYRCLYTGTNNATATLEDSKVSMGSGAVAVQMNNGGIVRRTVVETDGSGNGLWLGKGSLLEDTVINAGDGDGASVTDATVQRVAIRAHRALGLQGKTLVRDSLVVSTGDHQAGLASYGTSTIRNVTAIAQGADADGLYADAALFEFDASVNARNVIARGTAHDVTGTAAIANCPCPAVPLDIGYSNFRTAGPQVNGAAGHNQSANPRFVDAPNGNYRLAPGSPAIDAGIADGSIGATDVAGGPRKKGAAPDLGAFEATPLPKPADYTAPVLSKVKVKRIAPARVNFTLSENATVRVTIRRAVKAGKPGKARTLTFAGKPGPNSDKIAKTALQPGQFTVTLVATDAAKNKSAPVTRKLLVKPH